MGHLHGLSKETGRDQDQNSLAIFLAPKATPQQPALNDDGECQDRRRQEWHHYQTTFDQEGKKVLTRNHTILLTPECGCAHPENDPVPGCC
jgi:hypothetical protein